MTLGSGTCTHSKVHITTAGCIGIFHKYCYYTNRGGITTNLKSLGILPICQNATVRVCGAWIRIYYVLCSKIYSTFGGLFWIPAGSRRADRSASICESRLLEAMSHTPPTVGWGCVTVYLPNRYGHNWGPPSMFFSPKHWDVKMATTMTIWCKVPMAPRKPQGEISDR